MKSRLRMLRVAEARYTWTARLFHHDDGSDCYRCVRLRVWGEGKNTRVLCADLVSTSEPGPWGRCTTDTVHPTPRDVRAVIELALARGWDPASSGAPFVLGAHVAAHGAAYETASAPEIRGFRVAGALLVPRRYGRAADGSGT